MLLEVLHIVIVVGRVEEIKSQKNKEIVLSPFLLSFLLLGKG
jgi:hypothetical protein